MAYNGFTSGNRFTVARTYSAATELSVHCWVKRTSGDGTVVSMWEDSGAVYQFALFLGSDGSGSTYVSTTSNTYGAVLAAGLITAGDWVSYGMSWSQNLPVRAWINGVNSASSGNTAGVLKTFSASFGIGARQAGNGAATDVALAEVSTWTRALSMDEWGELADGRAPNRIPRSQDVYIPMVREVKDFKGNYTVTTTGSPTVANHPRIYR